MADSVPIDTSPLPSDVEIDTIEPFPELKSVHPECEILSPISELQKIPLTGEIPLPIGGGVYPVIEENNNELEGEEADERIESVEEEIPPVKETPSVEEEEKRNEEEKHETEVAEEPTLEEEEPLGSEDKNLKEEMEIFFQKRKNKTMTTLLESTMAAISKQLQPVTDKMYEKKYPLVDNLLDRLEKASGTKRENLVYGASVFVIVYFFVGAFVQILCNLVGVVYPAWCSIRAVRSVQKEDDTQWLIYWVVFASFSVVDLSSFSLIPFYWLAKVVFLLYLYLPSFKGANVIYAKYIDPACTTIETYFTPAQKKDN